MTNPSEINAVIVPRTADLGDGFTVRRALPHQARRMVGPFVFFDEMGPVVLKEGHGLDVRPHPHIGLATVTYLFDGVITHRDSLGVVQDIHPGDVNWMTAGRGIVHSERSPSTARTGGARLYGIQSWVALPKTHEETDPTFVRYAAQELPAVRSEGVDMRVIAGEVFGVRSPVATLWDMFYADARLDVGARLALPRMIEERAVFVVEGTIAAAGQVFEAGVLVVFNAAADAVIEAQTPCRLMLLGGAAMDGPRHIWWNFVSSRKDRIEAAKEDWKAGRFPAVPGESEFIPLP